MKWLASIFAARKKTPVEYDPAKAYKKISAVKAEDLVAAIHENKWPIDPFLASVALAIEIVELKKANR